MATSTKQIEANRRNAQKSTGPKTKAGKNRSRYNAKKQGLLTETFAPIEDSFEHKKDLKKLTDALYDEYFPKSTLEKILVERLISVTWRLRRIQLIDANAFENQFQSKERAAMIDSENLNLICRYESMLNRQFYQLIYRLEKLQDDRKSPKETRRSPKETRISQVANGKSQETGRSQEEDRISRVETGKSQKEKPGKSPKETETNPPNVKIRNEPIEEKDSDKHLRSNHSENAHNSARSRTPRPTAIRSPAVNSSPQAAMRYPSNSIGIFPTNATKGGSIRPKLI